MRISKISNLLLLACIGSTLAAPQANYPVGVSRDFGFQNYPSFVDWIYDIIPGRFVKYFPTRDEAWGKIVNSARNSATKAIIRFATELSTYGPTVPSGFNPLPYGSGAGFINNKQADFTMPNYFNAQSSGLKCDASTRTCIQHATDRSYFRVVQVVGKGDKEWPYGQFQLGGTLLCLATKPREYSGNPIKEWWQEQTGGMKKEAHLHLTDCALSPKNDQLFTLLFDLIVDKSGKMLVWKGDGKSVDCVDPNEPEKYFGISFSSNADFSGASWDIGSVPSGLTMSMIVCKDGKCNSNFIEGPIQAFPSNINDGANCGPVYGTCRGTCRNAKCYSSNLDVGSTCGTYGTCRSGLYCKNSQCIVSPTCGVSNDPCNTWASSQGFPARTCCAGHECNSVAASGNEIVYICRALGPPSNLPVGSACGGSSGTCRTGLTCTNNVCTAPPSPSPSPISTCSASQQPCGSWASYQNFPTKNCCAGLGCYSVAASGNQVVYICRA